MQRCIPVQDLALQADGAGDGGGVRVGGPGPCEGYVHPVLHVGFQPGQVDAPAVPDVQPQKQATNSQQDREARREMARLKNRFSNLEKAIATIESQMAEIEKVLSAPGEKDDIMELTRQYLEHKRELDIKMEEWALLADKLE